MFNLHIYIYIYFIVFEVLKQAFIILKVHVASKCKVSCTQKYTNMSKTRISLLYISYHC